MDLKLFGEVFVTLLVIVDPPGMVPVFLALTGSMSSRARMKAGTQAVLLALGVIVVFAVAGQTLLDYLHVQLPALQGAGGLLLVLVALQLLTGKADAPEEQGGTSATLVVPPCSEGSSVLPVSSCSATRTSSSPPAPCNAGRSTWR